MVLPLATKTKIHMTGSIRSWIHFLDLRDDSHAQKEVQELAREVKRQFADQFPIIAKALGYRDEKARPKTHTEYLEAHHQQAHPQYITRNQFIDRINGQYGDDESD